MFPRFSQVFPKFIKVLFPRLFLGVLKVIRCFRFFQGVFPSVITGVSLVFLRRCFPGFSQGVPHQVFPMFILDVSKVFPCVSSVFPRLPLGVSQVSTRCCFRFLHHVCYSTWMCRWSLVELSSSFSVGRVTMSCGDSPSSLFDDTWYLFIWRRTCSCVVVVVFA